MKILYIIDSHPENGGAPISTVSIATEMSKTHHKVCLILPTQIRKYKIIDNIETIEIGGFYDKFPFFIFHPFKAIKLVKELKKEIARLKPDIIHVHMPRAAWAIGILRFLNGLQPDIKLIYTDRDQVGTYVLPVRLLSTLLIKFKYDEIVCLTSIATSYWKRKKGTPNVGVIPNSAGLAYENYNSSMHSKIKQGFGLEVNTYTVMFSGRMSVDKNWGLAKEIVMRLKDEDIVFVFAISTMDPTQEKSFKDFNEYMKLCGAKYLMFHNVSQEDMARYYYMSDVFVLTSDRESFGRTAIEAMSRKCVVIGRNVGGLPEVIGKMENVLENDVEAFCKRILFYKFNKNQLIEDKEWFFKKFNNTYTVNANTEKHLLLYKPV